MTKEGLNTLTGKRQSEDQYDRRSTLDFSKAPEGIDWGVALIPQLSPSPGLRYIAEVGGVQCLGKTAQEAFDKALAEYERMLEQEAGA